MSHSSGDSIYVGVIVIMKKIIYNFLKNIKFFVLTLFKHTLFLFFFLFLFQFTNVNANENLPDRLFGIKLLDSVKNYKVLRTQELEFAKFSRHFIDPPNKNNAFTRYFVTTNLNANNITKILGMISKTDYRLSVTKLIQNNSEPACTSEFMPKYVKALSNSWNIEENQFDKSKLEFYTVPDNLMRKLDISVTRSTQLKNNRYAKVECRFFYFPAGSKLRDGEVKEPILNSVMTITLGTSDFFQKDKLPTLVKDISVGDFIRKISKNVSNKGF